jgi:ribonuclease BN (tRNA processing enzyme)
VRITVLGKSPSWQDSGGACSGYLVREGNFALLLDCGSGVFAKLREAIGYRAVDAVLISHLHADHILDLVPFSYGLLYSPAAPATPVRPALHAPPGATVTLRAVAGSWGSEKLVESAFELTEYDPLQPLGLGPLRASFCEVPHFTRAFAIELRAPSGARFTFGADCAPSDALVEFARGSDLLMLEATLREPETGQDRGHMTAREAGELASRAQARRVVLTHFSDELDRASVRAEGEAGYGAPVELAAVGAQFTI